MQTHTSWSTFVANGNRTIVSGYMPVGYQHGFIFEQFDVARTYAHELSHGAFALHHTFSDHSESFHANEGTTTNLMDYADGSALNHKQWTWMHEKHGSGVVLRNLKYEEIMKKIGII